MIRKIGMIGLGLMGSAIAENLLKEGFQVIGYDILPPKIDELKSKKGIGAGSCQEVAEYADAVILSLAEAHALKEVVEGHHGLVQSKKDGLILIETSTLSLETKLEARKTLSAAGMALLDCPLSGTAAQAALKDIVVLASGDADRCKECIPVFNAFARSHFYLGEFGMGSKMKFIANLLVAIHNVSAAEALVMGMKAGLNPQVIYDVICDGAGSSRMFEVRGPLMVSEKYDEVTMKVDVFQKDIDLITAFAENLGAPTPLLTAAARIYHQARENGYAKLDTASVCAVLEKQAGVERN